MAVIGLGLVALVPILYYASTVDGRPPTVLRVSLTQHLTGGADTALTTTSIEVDFSEPVEHATAEAAFVVHPAVDGSFSWSSASLTFTPAARLPLRTDFEVTIGPGVRDVVGNRMVTAAQPFSFTTVGNPSVVASDPAEAEKDVALDSPIVVDFSTLMDTASVELSLRLAPSTEVRLRWTRERLTIVPLAPLDPNRRYTLTIGVRALDQAGTPLADPFTLTFDTVLSSLRADTLIPAAGVAGVAINSPIAIAFDRALDPGSVHDDLLSIDPAVAGSLDAIAAPGAAGLVQREARVLRFQPSGALEPNTTYEVTLRPGLLGTDGAGLPAGVTWSFTTGAPTATLSNQIVFVSDRAGIANLWAMNADGTSQRQLSAELSPVIDYAVAPDGRAFVVGDGAVLVWQRADGSARRLLTDTGTVEFDPAYSPDGSTLVFGRADPSLGSGLGLWMRDGDGSDPRPVELPTDRSAAPSPSPAAPVPLLRTPRISPDGTALAFVDDAGWVSILDLETGHLSAARFFAQSEPTWLPDGSGVLVSGLTTGSGGAPRAYRPRSSVPLLDPASFGLDAVEVAALRVVRLDRDATSLSSTAFGRGAARPTVDAGGRIGYLKLEAAGAEAGSPWVADGLNAAGSQVMRDPGALAGHISFTPEPEKVVISRIPATGDVTTAARGIWLVTLPTGGAEQLSTDGWLPRWLP
ncbi:MAG: Ig-like domain-containing protein [Candidatus Limnocylindria bacterium]